MSELASVFGSLQTMLAAHRPRADRDGGRPRVREAVPVTLLTGFLGAGKTTLLAALLAAPPADMAIQAVVNDVGALRFDPSLLIGGQGQAAAADGGGRARFASDGVVELANGCGCCAADGQLGEALERAAMREPDLVVLEASGVADPYACAQVVEAGPSIRLDRIVAAVDARSFRLHLAMAPLRSTLLRQLEACDVVVLTGSDGLDAAAVEPHIDHLAELAPGRPIVTSSLAAPAVAVLAPGGIRGAPLAGLTPRHAHPLITLTRDQHRILTRRLIERLLIERPKSILRCKGRLVTAEGPILLQATSSGWDVSGTDGGQRISGQVTMVGTDRRDLDRFAANLGLRPGL